MVLKICWFLFLSEAYPFLLVIFFCLIFWSTVFEWSYLEGLTHDMDFGKSKKKYFKKKGRIDIEEDVVGGKQHLLWLSKSFNKQIV